MTNYIDMSGFCQLGRWNVSVTSLQVASWKVCKLESLQVYTLKQGKMTNAKAQISNQAQNPND